VHKNLDNREICAYVFFCGKQGRPMARVSIYVPADLKARMDRVRDSANWSEVARPAILSAIASYEQRKGADMNAVVERLRASKEKHLLEIANSGRERGRLWAREKAEFVELRRVVDLAGGDDHDALDGLKSAINPRHTLDRIEFADLIGVEERDMSNEYAAAFAEGAAEVYDQVLAAESRRKQARPDKADQRKR
jgi:hypothetical protein